MARYNCPSFTFNVNRAVGRYLRSLSPIKSISDDSTQELSLNDILEGKRRKLSARMFYETLVTFSKLRKIICNSPPSPTTYSLKVCFILLTLGFEELWTY